MSTIASLCIQGIVPEDLRIRRIRLPGGKKSATEKLSTSLFDSKHTSDNLDLGNAVRVSENDTNLRRSGTLSGELGDLLNDLVGGGLQPRRGSAGVGDRGGRNALSVAVKSTHLVGLALVMLRMRSWRRSIVKFPSSTRVCVEQ